MIDEIFDYILDEILAIGIDGKFNRLALDKKNVCAVKQEIPFENIYFTNNLAYTIGKISVYYRGTENEKDNLTKSQLIADLFIDKNYIDLANTKIIKLTSNVPKIVYMDDDLINNFLIELNIQFAKNN